LVTKAKLLHLYHFSVAPQPHSGLGHLTVQDSRSHTDSRTHAHTHIPVRTPMSESSDRRRGRCL